MSKLKKSLFAITVLSTVGISQAALADQYCREFQEPIIIGGRTVSAYGTACQQPDGSWQVVSGDNNIPAGEYVNPQYVEMDQPVYPQAQVIDEGTPDWVAPAAVGTFAGLAIGLLSSDYDHEEHHHDRWRAHTRNERDFPVYRHQVTHSYAHPVPHVNQPHEHPANSTSNHGRASNPTSNHGRGANPTSNHGHDDHDHQH